MASISASLKSISACITASSPALPTRPSPARSPSKSSRAWVRRVFPAPVSAQDVEPFYKVHCGVLNQNEVSDCQRAEHRALEEAVPKMTVERISLAEGYLCQIPLHANHHGLFRVQLTHLHTVHHDSCRLVGRFIRDPEGIGISCHNRTRLECVRRDQAHNISSHSRPQDRSSQGEIVGR